MGKKEEVKGLHFLTSALATHTLENIQALLVATTLLSMKGIFLYLLGLEESRK